MHEGVEPGLTQEGVVVGTVDYLAPEQAVNASNVDTRADIYSLGCTFYYLLTGQVPFPGETALEKLIKHRSEEPAPVEQVRPEVPTEVGAVVRKMMAKRPEDRYQTPAEVAAVLKDFTGRIGSGRTSPAPATSPMPLPVRPAAAEPAGEAGTAPASPWEGLADIPAPPRPVGNQHTWLLGSGLVLLVAVLVVTVYLMLR
jgi:serine/threonine-protein kinase